MAIREFELFHGAVITKICRNDQPISLTLIETNENRAVYRLNVQVVLYIKHSTTPKPRRRGKTTWQFTFQAEHIKDLVRLQDRDEVYMALVCGHHKLEEDMEICLLYPQEIGQCLDLNTFTQQWLSVEMEPRRSLRIYGPLNADERRKLVIERNRPDNWQVPDR